MCERRPLLICALGLAAAVATHAELARACSCTDIDPREGLAAGDTAVVGRVISKRLVDESPRSFDRTYVYTLRVRRSFGRRLGRRLELRANSNGGLCGVEFRVGERVGSFLGGRPGRYTTNTCRLVDPADLIRAARPLPRPRASGRVALLASGSFLDARLMALDRRGRVLGYGFGPGQVTAVSVCPGAGVVAELVESARGTIVALRRVNDFRLMRRVRAPGGTLRIHCADPAGHALYGYAIQVDSARPRGRIVILGRRSPARTLYRGTGSDAGFGGSTGYLTARRSRRRLVAVDLISGVARGIARVPSGSTGFALSPDGARLAALAEREDGTDVGVVVDRRSRSTVTRQLPFSGGSLSWIDPGRLVYASEGGRSLLLDSTLRRLRLLPAVPGADGTARR